MNGGLQLLTLAHVLISLAGIASGFVVIYGFLTGRRLDRWTAIFLATTVLTSLTGFLFPIERLTPGMVIGIVSLLVLAVAMIARYRAHLDGRACGLRGQRGDRALSSSRHGVFQPAITRRSIMGLARLLVLMGVVAAAGMAFAPDHKEGESVRV